MSLISLLHFLNSFNLRHSEPYHTEESFAEDTTAHLAGTQFAVDKDDGHLFNLEAQAERTVLHLNLEGIALEAYLLQVYGFQYLAAIADKAGCLIVQSDANDETYLCAGVI